MTMATTINTATSESARSNVFDLGVTVVSGGGMASRRRRYEFVVEPTADPGFHKVVQYNQRLGVTAPLALKRAVVAVDLSQLNLHKNHPGLRALRAALSDAGRMG
jgi:hypothetical protein